MSISAYIQHISYHKYSSQISLTKTLVASYMLLAAKRAGRRLRRQLRQIRKKATVTVVPGVRLFKGTRGIPFVPFAFLSLGSIKNPRTQAMYDTLLILLIKAGQLTILISLFALVVLILRFLFGKNGRLRDPSWQTIEEAEKHLSGSHVAKAQKNTQNNPLSSLKPQDLHEKLTACDPNLFPEWLQGYARTFLDYAGNFFHLEEDIARQMRLKCEHTWRVVLAAQRILQGEAILQNPESERILLLSALFHDIARFEQFKRYRTFSDTHTCNHGHFGVRILNKNKILQSEPRHIRKAVLLAVALHNAFAVPNIRLGLAHFPLLVLRDADKLDILRVMQSHLGQGATADAAVVMYLQDAPEQYSMPIWQALEAGSPGVYTDMRFHNDFRLLLCSWIGEFAFGESRKIVRDDGLLLPILDGLVGIPEVQAKARAIVEKRLGGA